MHRLPIWLSLALLLAACSTYHYSNDAYIAGIRSFDKNDFDAARRNWEPLASAGDCDAQYRVGMLYFLGAGVPQDYKIAHQWWTTAADQGEASAQMLLATMYAHDSMSIMTMGSTTWFVCEKGCGYETDMLAAYQWMRLAQRLTPYDSGRRYAGEKAAKYWQSLTSEQASTTYEYLRTWRPNPAQCKQREITQL